MTTTADDLYAKSDAIGDQIRALEHERTLLRDKARWLEKGGKLSDMEPAAPKAPKKVLRLGIAGAFLPGAALRR